MTHQNNILLNKISGESIIETIPIISNNIEHDKFLILDTSGNLKWQSLLSDSIHRNIDKNGDIRIEYSASLEHFGMYNIDNRIGIGRAPLKNYQLDIMAPKDCHSTALHIGDGVYGFSMGNGTTNGFVPEIIGIGSDSNDPGLYLLGKTSSYIASDIPLIIIDGRNNDNTPLQNRPIVGITNGNYNNYNFVVDYDGKVGLNKKPEIYNLEINGIALCDELKISVDGYEKSNKDIDSSKILELTPSVYTKIGNNRPHYGFDVDNMKSLYPEIVGHNKKREPIDISYIELIPILVDIIQHQHARISELEDKIM